MKNARTPFVIAALCGSVIAVIWFLWFSNKEVWAQPYNFKLALLIPWHLWVVFGLGLFLYYSVLRET